MRVLVTGGTGVVGEMTVTELLARGHEVRLFSRRAERDAAQWLDGVDARPGDIGNAGDVKGAATGCHAVAHVAGIVAESLPDETFERVNVRGTMHILREAERASISRFVYVSSLGAERGESDYHRSKRAAEDLVQRFEGNWTILRPGNVYGPGDEVISLLLRMVRTLPAVPVIDNGDEPFQPIWSEDLARAIAETVDRRNLATRILELAGVEQTSMNDVLDRLGRITGKSPPRIPVPGFLATLGTKAAEMLRLRLPVSEGQIRMLLEGNVLRDPTDNSLTTTLGITPTPLDLGLALLADALPEQVPDEGVGALERKRFWADIFGSPFSAEGLFEIFRRHFAELTAVHLPVAVEPGTTAEIEPGATITMSLPLRGTVQVRVDEIRERRMTLVTVDGHPLAGAVRFLAEERGPGLRFEIQTYDRPATIPDWVMIRSVGGAVQSRTWQETIERVVAASGGLAPGGVERERTLLDEKKAGEIEEWVEDLVIRRKRAEREEDRQARSP
jgi:NADH dehydrogenase